MVERGRTRRRGVSYGGFSLDAEADRCSKGELTGIDIGEVGRCLGQDLELLRLPGVSYRQAIAIRELEEIRTRA